MMLYYDWSLVNANMLCYNEYMILVNIKETSWLKSDENKYWE